MSEEIEDLSETLLQIYTKNLIFLKEFFPKTFEEIDTFSKKLEMGDIQANFTLEYIDGYFDIKNLNNNGFYYAENSYIDADKRKNYVDYSTNNSLNLLLTKQFSNKLHSTTVFKDANPIIEYINEKVDLDNITFQKIEKFIFIGTGLGLHLQEINKKIRQTTTLIIEPELEIFRLSLFVTDYSIFEEDDKKLFLSIEENKIEQDITFRCFYNHHNYSNYNIKYYNLLESLSYIKDEMIDFFGVNNELGFPYKLVLQNLEKTVSFIKNGERFISSKLIEKENLLKDKKVLLISAGPSLDNYIEWIKMHQHKFIVICVDVILKKLEKHGIVPNIVFSIDPSILCATYLKTENPNFLEKSAVFFLSQQHENVLEVMKGKNYYFSQVLPIVKEIGHFGSSSNVGTYSFKMAIALGARELYLIGNDAAFNQDTGSRYTKDSSFIQSHDINKEETKEFSKDQNVEVKGNLRETVKSNKDLLRFKTSYEIELSYVKEHFELKVYNLSDGAYIEGLTPMNYEEINSLVDTFPNKETNIVEEFNKISKTVEEISFEEDIIVFNSVITKVKKFQTKKFKSKDIFKNEKIQLMVWILETTKELKNSTYANIFLKYTSLVDIYINFLLNIKQEDIHTKEGLKTINNLWAKGVIVLFKDMKNAIKD